MSASWYVSSPSLVRIPLYMLLLRRMLLLRLLPHVVLLLLLLHACMCRSHISKMLLLRLLLLLLLPLLLRLLLLLLLLLLLHLLLPHLRPFPRSLSVPASLGCVAVSKAAYVTYLYFAPFVSGSSDFHCSTSASVFLLIRVFLILLRLLHTLLDCILFSSEYDAAASSSLASSLFACLVCSAFLLPLLLIIVRRNPLLLLYHPYHMTRFNIIVVLLAPCLLLRRYLMWRACWFGCIVCCARAL